MTRDPHERRPGHPDLGAALKDALATPFHEVNWNDLHERILVDAAAHFRHPPARAADWIAAWAPRGIPVAGSALAAAVVVLMILPAGSSRPAAAETGQWPVAEELMSRLPEDTRDLLTAGTDVNSMLRAMLAQNGGDDGS